MFFEVRLLLPEVFKILNITSRGDLLKIIGDHFEDKPFRLQYQGDSKVEDGNRMNFNRLILGVVDLEDLVPLSQHLGLDEPIWANITDRSMPKQRIQCATHPDTYLLYSTFAQVRAEMERGAEFDHDINLKKMLVRSLLRILMIKKKASIPRDLEIQICSTIMRAEKALEVLYGLISVHVMTSPVSNEIHIAAREEMKVEDIIPACSVLVERLLDEVPWEENASKFDIRFLVQQYHHSVGREVVEAED